MAQTNTSSEFSVQKNRIGKGETALLVILGIETVFFGSLSAAYLLMRTSAPVWAPDLSVQFRWLFPGLNTLLILSSAWVISRSSAAVRRGNRSALLASQQVTLLMGLLFITAQVFDFRHSGMAINDAGLGGAFFALLGFHAVHVLGAVIFLGVNIMRTYLGDFSHEDHSSVVIGALFWYYVTFVWVVLFTLLYIL
jgi:cytochrome c oxidase subunit III